jgi:hypothetical protein
MAPRCNKLLLLWLLGSRLKTCKCINADKLESQCAANKKLKLTWSLELGVKPGTWKSKHANAD